MLTKIILATASAVIMTLAGVEAALAPSYPSPNTVWTEGQEYEILWNDDNKTAWKSFSIDFMTGDNINQIKLATVASNLDSTTVKSYKWKAPTVDPHSAVYFFMFTQGEENAWTTRFAIVGADGKQVPPENAKQPDGSSIGWGVGKLASGAGNATTTGNGTNTTPAAITTTAATQTAASQSVATESSSANIATVPSSTPKAHTAGNAASNVQPALAAGVLAVAALAGLSF